jgi:hypothetical protein
MEPYKDQDHDIAFRCQEIHRALSGLEFETIPALFRELDGKNKGDRHLYFIDIYFLFQ